MDRAQRLRQRIAASLESDNALGGYSTSNAGTFGLPPSLDPSLVLETALPAVGGGWDETGDVLGQLFYGSRPAEAAGASQFGNYGVFRPSPQLSTVRVQAISQPCASRTCQCLCQQYSTRRTVSQHVLPDRNVCAGYCGVPLLPRLHRRVRSQLSRAHS